MERTRKMREIYRSEGLPTLLVESWSYALEHSPLSGPLKRIVGDTVYEQALAAPQVGYWPQIDQPRSFSEHVLHRKLWTDEPLYSTVADKVTVREYVEATVGSDVLTDVLYVTDDPETIPFEDLPAAFVLKATHGSNMSTVVRDKERERYDDLVAECREWLAADFGDATNEYWYLDIDPQILVEAYIDADGREVPLDYKIYVFDGRAEYVHVDIDRQGDHSRAFYDREWNEQGFELTFPRAGSVDEPSDLDRMLSVAEALGEDFDFARVDLYNPREGVVLFGEITLAPGAGNSPFTPTDADFELGRLWPDRRSG